MLLLLRVCFVCFYSSECDSNSKPESTEPSGGGAGKGPDGDGDGIVLADFGWKAPVVDLLVG